MAIRFNAVGDTLDLTTSLPLNASFTVICDAQVISDVGAPAVQPLYMALNAALTHGYYLLWEGGTNGVMEMVTLSGGGVVDQYSFPSRPVEGSAFVFYLRCSGTGANQFECGWRYPNSAWVRGTADLTGAVNQVTTVYLNAVAATYYTNHRKQNLKIWTRCLSQQEIDDEAMSATPVYVQSLHSYFPLSGANDFVDRGPYRRPLTRAGTNETEYFNFPRPTKKRRIPVPYEPPVGGGVFQILAGRRFSLAGAHGLAGD